MTIKKRLSRATLTRIKKAAGDPRLFEIVRTGRRVFRRRHSTAGPEVAIGLERTNFFAASTVAEKEVKELHFILPSVRSDARFVG